MFRSTLVKALISQGLPLLAGKPLFPSAPSNQPEQATRALLKLKAKAGGVVVIIGSRGSGKTVLAWRLAQFLNRKTYGVSPNQKMPDWVEEVAFEDIADLPRKSTLILDDIPMYASSRDYHLAAVRAMEKTIPVCRHKGIMIIFITQTSGFADRWVLDADAVFLKKPSILYAEIERPAVKKWVDKAVVAFKGMNEAQAKRHAYLITDEYAGIISVRKSS